MNPVLANKNYLNSLTHIERKKYLQKVRLIRLLHTAGAKSNAEICRLLNISSPTSLIFLNELMQQGLIEKRGKGRSIGGRKPELYSLCDQSFYVLCIGMDRFKTNIAILDNNYNNITGVHSFALRMTEDDAAIDQLHDFANELIDSSGIPAQRLVGVGLSMPGLVDKNKGINYTYLISPSDSYPLLRKLSEKFQRPVYIQNDVKTNTLAELRFGLAAGKKDVLVLLMDWGIGLGIVMDGKLQNGMSGFSGEIGHIPFVDNGETCYCGKSGCLETVASGIALAKLAKDGLASGELTFDEGINFEQPEGPDPKILIQSAENGNQYAIRALQTFGEHLGKAIATLLQLFNPELIILGGQLAEAQHFIRQALQDSISRYSIARLNENTEIVPSALGTDAGLLGLASIVFENTFEKQIEQSNYRSTAPLTYCTAS